MRPGRYFFLKIIALLLPLSGPTVLAQAVPTENELLKLNADVIRTMTAYRESLEKLLSIYERDLQRQTGQVKLRRGLYEKGYISRRELEESERGRATTEANVKETELKITEARIAITEAVAREELLRLPPLAAGEYKETVALVRYNGGVDWS
ncbi:MAG: hypothetical protein HY694_08435, partial [Deltaproteobacteria bacterium]|nr:hypothetical protein [Deltaproteobacteria bacterium]